MTRVLDASAVLCWLNDEPGAERMEDVLATGEPTLIHAVNLVEAQYYFLRRGEEALRDASERIEAARIEVVRTMDEELLQTAVRLKANYPPIALGDVFAVALAIQRQATLLTTDRRELEKIALAGICRIEFLR